MEGNGTGMPRKGAWRVIVETLAGQKYRYNVDTERDADALALAVSAHSRDVARTQVVPA